jgi:hypothetical protein
MRSMSYDLAVFTPSSMSTEQMAALVAEGAGLSPEAGTGGSLTVVRGARRRYSFTVGGPDALEPEDVPIEVTAVLLGARHLWTVMVEGSAASEIPHAVRFARRLAKALNGAVLDPQTDEVWSRSKSRVIQKPAREERISEVRVDWFCLREHVAEDVVSLFLSTVGRYLPEALPRRFGEHEPLQGKYADSGQEGFSEAWQNATSLLYYAGSGPCIGGNLRAGPSERSPDRYWSVSMTFLAEPLHDQRWRDALREVFVDLADRLPAFYASAEVSRGHIWSGRTSWSDGKTEVTVRPMRYREGWVGLPPTPIWWTWVGAPYRAFFDRLPADRTSATAQGVLFENSTEPLARDDLAPLSAWLPEALFATLIPDSGNWQPVPVNRAAEIPAELR